MLSNTINEALSALLDKTDLVLEFETGSEYATDSSSEVHIPDAVVFPRNIDQVAGILQLANEHRVPVIPRGCGSGTAGGCLAEYGGIVLSTERLTRIVEIDPVTQTAKVEAGVLNDDLQSAAAEHGLFWPPDPSSAAYCSVGGNIATAAAGPRTFRYGGTRGSVLAVKAVTGAGEIIDAGTLAAKSSVGYDIVRLLTGSEGTLAIVCEATLRLTPLPKKVCGFVVQFSDEASAAKKAAELATLAERPATAEFFDGYCTSLVRKADPSQVSEDAVAMLLVEVHCDGTNDSVAAAVAAACSPGNGVLSCKRVDDTTQLWAARRELSPQLRGLGGKKFSEDVAVPVPKLPDLVTGLAKIADEQRTLNVKFGHAGDGNLHVHFYADPKDTDAVARAEEAAARTFDLALSLGGTISGEHGVGIVKRKFIAKEIDPTTMRLMRSIKSVFDPNNILNPGKIFPEP